MTRNHLFLFAAFIIDASVLLSGREATAGQVPAAGGPKAGRQLFVSKGCYECHGYAGQGTESGPMLAPGTKPLAFFEAIVRHPPNQMPPYSTVVLSKADLAAIHNFLTSLPAGRRSQDIAILQRMVPAGTSSGN